MRLLLIVPLLLASQFCLAQADTTLIDNRICIKTNPLAFIDVYGGYSYRLGAEVKVINNTAFSFELGKYYGLDSKLDVKIHPSGFIIRPEIKYYLNKHKLSVGSYISLDVFYKKINFDYADSIRFPSAPTFEKQYSISKDIYGINVKLGTLIVHKKKFVFEWYFGGGIRYIKGHNSLSSDENDHVLTGEGHGDLISDGQRVIKGIWPNLMIGFKIGYSVKSKGVKLLKSR
ncbi:hypothetical protein A4D02_13075 [Niastella koreensis]|uniref:Outer membrane protein beta-barrel domain-containing protein n=2 Tax=Niastella koreensis TaxID=354356 RepID=G8TMA4_NIAKG|nr:DUF3575 domain-containing protein [Niastella koreensis]AEW00886.1 hypothetical protein Niako_4629 [Niastella koreensis GR20-10]OQP42494.1 hypothetical protein A4D02_13075 [Niastella koreensis]